MTSPTYVDPDSLLPTFTVGHSVSGLEPLSGGRIRKVSSRLKIGRTLSWRPSSIEGYEALNSYVLIEGERAVMIDCGVRLGGDQIVSKIKRFLAGRKLACVVVSRLEPDCLSNLGCVVQELQPDVVYAPGGLDPLAFFDDINVAETLKAEFATTSENVKSELLLTVLGADRPLRLLPSRLRTLPTLWVSDEATSTLFCSDSFSQNVVSADFASIPFESFDAFVDHLLTKFDWLRSADRGEIVGWVTGLLGDYARLAPTRGGMIEGAAEVGRCLDALDYFHKTVR